MKATNLKYAELISKLTLEEKASLMSGRDFWNTKPIDRLGIPSIMLTDGPHGLRKQGGKADRLGLHLSLPATCFPTASALANSWDVELLETVGACLGTEAAANQVNVLLGPGLNIKRNPLCGRNFEYFSEDPFLSGKLSAAMIRGIQARGVCACPKHYAVNSQEERRMVINEIVDERTLREIYLEGFRYAVCEGGAKTLMTSYNRVNGVHANEHMHLLQDILYGEWGFDGVVVTDWGGEYDRVAGLVAGNQLEMPSSAGITDREIVRAVRTGNLEEALLDERVDSLLQLVFEAQDKRQSKTEFSKEEHHLVARKAASESAVLLKNDGNILPLTGKHRVAVIGDFASVPRYQGAGSSLIVPTRLDNALDALKTTELDVIGYESGFRRFGGKSEKRTQRAISLAKKADVTLLFLGLDEGSEAEGVDRSHMRLPENQIALLRALRGVCDKIVVILSNGAPVETNWSNLADAILLMYLGGQAVGSATADLITGRANPSGKLAETYPVAYADVPSSGDYPGKQKTAEHRESIFVGYRYFDTAGVEPAWPFGYGLSYTTFAYEGLSYNGESVSFTVKNTGKKAGSEIAQIYIGKHGSEVFRAKKELKGFTKVALQPGEEKEVRIPLDEHAFSYYNVKNNKWEEEPGEYHVMVGASSRDIRQSLFVQRKGDKEESVPYAESDLPHYYNADIANVSTEEFSALLGYAPPESKWNLKKPLGYDDTIGQGKYKNGFGRFLYLFVRAARRICFFFGKPIAANNVMFAMNLPYRQLTRLLGGRIDDGMLDGILVMANGRFFAGVRQTFYAWRQKRKQERRRRHDGED